MKTILITTTLIAVLTLGAMNINNIFAQMDPEDTSMIMEEEDMEMMGMDNEDMMMATPMSSNQSEGMMKLNGTIDVKTTIAEALKSKVTTDIIGAIQAAQASVGANSFVKEAELTEAHGYLVYKMLVVDENMKKYKVIVDPGNGQVLLKKEITSYDEHDKMKYDDKKEMIKILKIIKMMMKDKEY